MMEKMEKVIGCMDNITLGGQKILLMDTVIFNKMVGGIADEDEEIDEDYKIVSDMILFLNNKQNNYIAYKLHKEGHSYEAIAKAMGYANKRTVWNMVEKVKNNQKTNDLLEKFIETNNKIADFKAQLREGDDE